MKKKLLSILAFFSRIPIYIQEYRTIYGKNVQRMMRIMALQMLFCLPFLLRSHKVFLLVPLLIGHVLAIISCLSLTNRMTQKNFDVKFALKQFQYGIALRFGLLISTLMLLGWLSKDAFLFAIFGYFWFMLGSLICLVHHFCVRQMHAKTDLVKKK